MKFKGVNWKNVPVTGGGGGDFTGLAAFKECCSYEIVSDKKNRKKKTKKLLKRKSDTEAPKQSPKKSKKNTSNQSFDVDNLDEKDDLTPSKSKNIAKNGKVSKNKVKSKEKKDKQKLKAKKAKEEKQKGKSETKKIKNVEKIEEENMLNLSLDDMKAWSSFNIPEPILRALADQGFSRPTTIQELTLPSAMLGKRDILGAAETGSGKTLAFGVPILSGILNIKTHGQSYNTKNKRQLKKEPENKKNVEAKKLKEFKEKIVNLNKLSKEEKLKLLQESKKPKMKKNFKKGRNSEEEDMDFLDDDGEEDDMPFDDSSDDDEEDEVENIDQEDEDEIESDSDAEEIENDSDEVENDSDEDEVENDSEEEVENDSDDEEVENDSNEDEEVENDSNEDDEEEDSDDNENSDEEMADEKNHKNKKSVKAPEADLGCVNVIDNIPSDTGPFAKLATPKENLKPLYALILTPTRELAIQVKNHLVAAAKHTDIKVAVVLGGMAQVKQERILSKGPEIVVATPGRLWEMIQQGNDHLSQFADIRFLAIDETDRMIERGHFEELHHILERLNDDFEKRQKRQNFVFSATLTMVHELPKYLKTKKFTKKGKIINKKAQKMTSDQKLKQLINLLGIMDPKIVDVTTKNQGTSETLLESKIVCSIDHKDYYLFYVLKRFPGRTIVFCNSIGCVKRLSQLFGILKCKPLPIHASMQQRQRLKNLDKFRDDPYGVLIATDVAARGLDIPNVDHVIHYQVPRTAENYVHRSGRTARANKEGITILLIEPGEAQNYGKICRTLSKTDEVPNFPIPDALLAATKTKVDLARELDQIELRTRKNNSEVGWYEKAMQEMDIILDDKEMPQKFDKDETEILKNSLKIKKKQLTSLLNKPLFPRGFSFKFPSSTHVIDQVLKNNDTQNALEAMKSALSSGSDKKFKKTSRNEAILKLETQDVEQPAKEKAEADISTPQTEGKVNKNKWKKLKRGKDTPV